MQPLQFNGRTNDCYSFNLGSIPSGGLDTYSKLAQFLENCLMVGQMDLQSIRRGFESLFIRRIKCIQKRSYSIVVKMSRCHREVPGSIPGRTLLFLKLVQVSGKLQRCQRYVRGSIPLASLDPIAQWQSTRLRNGRLQVRVLFGFYILCSLVVKHLTFI